MQVIKDTIVTLNIGTVLGFILSLDIADHREVDTLSQGDPALVVFYGFRLWRPVEFRILVSHYASGVKIDF